jgi:hypothetical protein
VETREEVLGIRESDREVSCLEDADPFREARSSASENILSTSPSCGSRNTASKVSGSRREKSGERNN